MSSTSIQGRHRAVPARGTNPVAAISNAVSSNAGVVGRRAAVIAAASGLILGAGLPAQAAPAERAASVVTDVDSLTVQPSTVTAPAVDLDFPRPQIETVAPAPDADTPDATDPEVAVQADDVEPVDAAADASAANLAANSERGTQAAATTPASDDTAKAPSTDATTTGETPDRSGSSTGGLGAVVSAAYSGLGHPYVWGGTTPAGWDCSGFVQWAYAQAGIDVPRVNQWAGMTPTSSPKPGDLVVQNGGVHVGIYVGGGEMISALNPSQGTILHAPSATGSSSYYTMP